MLKEELILLDMECKSREEVLITLSNLLYKSGAVKNTFQEAVLKREVIYPTGLPADAFDIAIPHTDGEHTIFPAMAVGVLKEPVVFQQMGSPEIELKPRLVMMLAINDPKTQLGTLMKIMDVIQNEDKLKKIICNYVDACPDDISDNMSLNAEIGLPLHH